MDSIKDSGCKSDWSMKSRCIGCFSAKLIVMLLAVKTVKTVKSDWCVSICLLLVKSLLVYCK